MQPRSRPTGENDTLHNLPPEVLSKTRELASETHFDDSLRRSDERRSPDLSSKSVAITLGLSPRLTPKTFSTVHIRANPLPPPAISEIPFHSFSQPTFECLLRMPSKLLADFPSVNCISKVMPGPIGNEPDEPFSWAGAIRGQFVHKSTNCVDNGYIGSLAVAADIVALPVASSFSDQKQRTCVIFDVKPITHIFARPINR